MSDAQTTGGVSLDQVVDAVRLAGYDADADSRSALIHAFDLVGGRLSWELATNLYTSYGWRHIPSFSALAQFHRFAMLMRAAANVVGLERLIPKLVNKKSGHFSKDTLSELTIAALLQPAGRVEVIAESQTKMPDITVETREHPRIVFDVEVRRAETKDADNAQHALALTLQQCLQGIEKNLWIFIDNITDQQDYYAIVEAALRIQPGQDYHPPAAPWSLVCLRGIDGAHEMPAPPFPPRWDGLELPYRPFRMAWDVSLELDPAHFTQTGYCRGLSWLPPPVSTYLNPILDKASRPQSRKGVPFVIAIDATALPGAQSWYERALPDVLSTFPDVAAVLLTFNRTSSFSQTDTQVHFNLSDSVPEGLAQALSRIPARFSY